MTKINFLIIIFNVKSWGVDKRTACALLNLEQYCCQFKIPFYCSNIYTVDTGIKGTTICPMRTYSNETADPLQVMVDQCNEENDFADAR